ncbi:MAG: ABC transporter permease [Pseudomonadota bacterium]
MSVINAFSTPNPARRFRLGAWLNSTVVENAVLPVLGIAAFLLIWSIVASQINTSLGAFPGPVEVSQQASALVSEHRREREKEAAFYQRQEERNAKRLEKEPDFKPKIRAYTGKPTYFDQILTSILTVLTGFVLASAIAIPAGIVIGLSRNMHSAVNPLVQLFKPVSPLAWLPLVTMVVSAVYVTDDPMFEKSFINSVVTVMLCSLWPTLINTSVGVANIDPDLQNVSRVLRLGRLTHVRRVVLPSSLPMIFTGLRLSLGVAWMVLIAAEMLAQNPGLGKFVWDEFQNGSSQSLARIMVAVITIGLIGFVLDRLMLFLLRRVAWDPEIAKR